MLFGAGLLVIVVRFVVGLIIVTAFLCRLARWVSLVRVFLLLLFVYALPVGLLWLGSGGWLVWWVVVCYNGVGCWWFGGVCRGYVWLVDLR